MNDNEKASLNKFLGRITEDPKNLYEQARKAGWTHDQIIEAHPAYANPKQRGAGREKLGSSSGGGGFGGVSDTREMQLGADLDPKSMMKRAGYKKGGKVSASSRADGIAQRGKTKGRFVK